MTHMVTGNREAALDGAPVDVSQQLEKLKNAPSREAHIATTEFLDSRLIPMGGVKKRWRELVPQTWEKLSSEIKTGTPAELLSHFKELEAIDDDAILKKMEESVKKGEYPDAKTYYDDWGTCLNYTLIHQGMAQDVRDIGKYVGEFDSTGKPTYGVLKVENCDFLPSEFCKTFVGKFGEDGLPLEGEIRGPGFFTKLKTKKNGSHHFTQINFEGGAVIDWDLRDGKRKIQKCVGISGDHLNGDRVVKKFNEEKVSAVEITLPSAAEIGQKFLPVRKVFEELRELNRERHPEGFQGLKDALAAREVLYSDTMFSELVGMKSEQDQQDKAIIEGDVRVKRGSRQDQMSEEEKGKFGNCREYGAQTQKIAIEQGLPHTFTLFGNPDHVFNVAALEDKMIAIDGWNGDAIYEFSPQEFYQNQSLHAIFGLSVHQDNWLNAEKNPRGLLHREDAPTMAAKDLLEARMNEINEARFDPEIQKIIQGRVEAKLSQLDPNDAYYHENAFELKSIINHFGLDPKLSKQLKMSVTIKTKYLGGLRTESTHLKSGNKIITDAPRDNKGKGEAFSPTDLLAGSLATCMITIMGIQANQHG